MHPVVSQDLVSKELVAVTVSNFSSVSVFATINFNCCPTPVIGVLCLIQE